ncbi:MAG: PDZ domain-containing protein [Syntrophobacteraceae bacterium]|jgi:serine protease Do
MLWLAPITVLGFVIILALMYGWVGEMSTIGSEMERPDLEAKLAAQYAAQAQQGGNLAHHLGPKFPAGIGNQQIQLAGQPGAPVNPPGQLAAQEGLQFPAGIGNQPIQLIDKAFSAGIGGGQIQLINQNVYLGLNLSELTPDVAGQLNIPSGSGLYVSSVVPASPAEKAGLKTGDVLIECEGTPVSTIDAAARIIGQKKVGQSIRLVVKRNGATKSLLARMGNVPLGLNVGGLRNAAWIGADVQSIDAVMKIRFNLPDRNGVIVTQIAPGSPAAACGLQVGDVIRRIGETRIRDVEQLESLVQKNRPGQKLSLTILRNTQQQVVSLTLGQKSADPNMTVAMLPPGDVAIEGSWIGMDVTELSAADAKDMGLQAGTKGILVSDVEGPPATVAGFQVGDVMIGINGTPTPDMKQFVAATQRQAGAVVDVIRGNRHIFISVPPPGFTAQGTELNTGINKKLRQVALENPVSGRFAIAAAGPGLNSPVAADAAGASYILMVDPGNNTFAVLNGTNSSQLPDVLGQNGVGSLICGNIDPGLAKMLSCAGICVYSGVVGSAADAVSLYQTSSLVAMKGF